MVFETIYKFFNTETILVKMVWNLMPCEDCQVHCTVAYFEQEVSLLTVEKRAERIDGGRFVYLMSVLCVAAFCCDSCHCTEGERASHHCGAAKPGGRSRGLCLSHGFT